MMLTIMDAQLSQSLQMEIASFQEELRVKYESGK